MLCKEVGEDISAAAGSTCHVASVLVEPLYRGFMSHPLIVQQQIMVHAQLPVDCFFLQSSSK